MQEKRFSLFNTTRWADRHGWGNAVVTGGDKFYDTDLGFERQWAPACCHVVPELYRGLFSERVIENMLAKLRHEGSQAVPFMNPEGIVIYHTAARTMFKKLLVGDEMSKTEAERRAA